MQLDCNEVHLWWADEVDFDQVELESVCLPWLGADDRTRWQRLRLARHRKQLLLGRFLLRTVLSKYSAATRPADWRFAIGANGKPALDTAVHTEPLSFNLSHSGGRIVVAITQFRPVGVDIEASARPRRVARLASRYFSASEADALLGLPPGQQRARFYQLWTLKEAYIKARGLGLAIPLQQFSFAFVGENEIRVTFDPGLLEPGAHWYFCQVAQTGDYQLALAVQQEAPGTTLQVRVGRISGLNAPAITHPDVAHVTWQTARS